MHCFYGGFCSVGFQNHFSCIAFLVLQGLFKGIAISAVLALFVAGLCGVVGGCSVYEWVLRWCKKAHQNCLFVVVVAEFLRLF
jgi:hypothetical protein